MPKVKANEIDLVYAVGEPSVWKFNEVKYSLRSVEKFSDGFGKVFIVGQQPPFFNYADADLICHIQHEDNHTNSKTRNSKARNIMEKVLRACDDERISENFFYLHDDHFFLKVFSIANYPFYYEGTLSEYIEKSNPFSGYRKTAENTLRFLESKKLPSIFYNVHRPVLINKKKFKKAMTSVDWSIDNGYLIKSLYLNSIGVEGVPAKDCNLIKWSGLREILKFVEGQEIFATSDSAVNQVFRDWMQKILPDKSKCEI